MRFQALLRQPRLVTRFVQERTILLMLRHPNVVRVRDLFSVGETLGLVMDLVDGGNLRDHLHRGGTVAPGEAARLGAQIAAALAEAPGAMIASGVATTAWHLGRAGGDSTPDPMIIVAPSVPELTAARGASRPPVDHQAKHSRKPVRAVAIPTADVRSTRSAAARRATRSPVPEAKPHGPWQCSQNFVIDLPGHSALGPRPCHSVGREVRFQGSLTGPAGGRARIEVTLRDSRTGRTVAGPATCEDLNFTRHAVTRGCGPAGASPRRGRTYTVVMSVRYVRDGRITTNTTRGIPFTW
ncbi:protein kinase domain-containing protein [Actinoplanes subglobosus]|uniref:Protein kinase n=1 Tax=Actinoplanes subglobosus TaxID=1547892 RepID=A0ABV8IKC0_9ACTN